MKLFKFGLRIWITVVSVIAFTTGWIVLSHSPKPVQWPIAAPAATLEPLPPMFDTSSQQRSNNFFSFLQRQSTVRPRSRVRFVTGGS